MYVQSARAATLWQDGIVRTSRQELRGAHNFDVVIVGGGYTGLWTAYYLQQLAPALKIAIIEANYIGFGGSGRNGGWCSAFLPMSPSEMMEQHGREAMLFAQQEMFATVDEVREVAQRESIECDFHKGGTITSASNPAHVQRLRDYVSDWQKLGFGPDVLRWQTADDISEKINVSRTFGGVYSPHCAVINPWKLVSGLADVVERRGAEIFENSSVINISERNVTTKEGHVTAKWVVRAVESFGSQLNTMKRSIAPLYSLMVATEPLSAEAWKLIGWNNRETFADGRNMVTYAQRTADGRIAFGGRGAPYHFASRIKPKFDFHRRIHAQLEDTVRETFPQLSNVSFTHHWGGPVGAPRDWHAYANVDRFTGLCAGGGYVGDGVALSNLVGRTIAHQIADTESPLTRSLLVGHQSKNWEVEPLRWIGINGLLTLTDWADRREQRTMRAASRTIAVRDGLLG